MFGYRDVWHYYSYITLADQVLSIKVPTFALGARDDQIADDSVTPREIVCKSESNVCVAVTDYGTHCCHITGRLIPRSWYPFPCMEFIEFLESQKQLAVVREESQI